MATDQRVNLSLILREATWVGKERPVIKHLFESSDGNKYVVFSTANWLKDISFNEKIDVTAQIKSTDERGIVLSKLRRVF